MQAGRDRGRKMAVCLWRRYQGHILAISPVRASFFSAAYLFLRGRTRISSTSPSLSAARHRYMRLPFIRTNTYQDASASSNTNDDQPGASGSPLRSAEQTGSTSTAPMVRTLSSDGAICVRKKRMRGAFDQRRRMEWTPHLSQRQRVSEIHHREVDDVWRTVEIAEGNSHPARL